MPFPNPVICCCDLYLCCIEGKQKHTCPREVDLGDCQVGPGDPDSIETITKTSTCEKSEEDCVCPEGEVDCTAVFYKDEPCVDGIPPASSSCVPDPGPCTKFKCGPCGPIADGCTLECPPNIPICPPQDCCEPPPPPTLCCCWTIAGGCVTNRACLQCPDNIPEGTHCYPVDTCSECFFPPNGPCILLTTTCCTSGDPDCCQPYPQPCCQPNPSICCCSGCSCALCCCDCATAGCAKSRCYCDCEEFVPPQPPLCPCTPGPSSNCGPFGPFAQEGKPNGFDTFAEGRLTSGFISVDSAYSLNTLFLFGYGNKHL